MNNIKMTSYLDETLKILKKHNPEEIILFGSMSNGTANMDSDIDLLVILNIDSIPKTYEEKMVLTCNIRRSLRNINKKVALDLLFYTKKEYAAMKAEKSLFLNEIDKTGKIIHEKAS